MCSTLGTNAGVARGSVHSMSKVYWAEPELSREAMAVEVRFEWTAPGRSQVLADCFAPLVTTKDRQQSGVGPQAAEAEGNVQAGSARKLYGPAAVLMTSIRDSPMTTTSGFGRWEAEVMVMAVLPRQPSGRCPRCLLAAVGS